jgi:hypothetical protein
MHATPLGRNRVFIGFRLNDLRMNSQRWSITNYCGGMSKSIGDSEVRVDGACHRTEHATNVRAQHFRHVFYDITFGWIKAASTSTTNAPSTALERLCAWWGTAADTPDARKHRCTIASNVVPSAVWRGCFRSLPTNSKRAQTGTKLTGLWDADT